MKRRTTLFKLVTQMVFIDRTRQDGAKFKSSLEVGCSRAKEATVVSVVTVDGYELREVAVELGTVGKQLDVVAVVRVDLDDDGAGLAITLEESAFAVVDDLVAADWGFEVSQHAMAFGRDPLTPGVRVGGSTSDPRACHWSVATGCGKTKVEARVL